MGGVARHGLCGTNRALVERTQGGVAADNAIFCTGHYVLPGPAQASRLTEKSSANHADRHEVGMSRPSADNGHPGLPQLSFPKTGLPGMRHALPVMQWGAPAIGSSQTVTCSMTSSEQAAWVSSIALPV